MQTFSKTLSPYEKWIVEVPGVFFRLISTQYPVSIQFLGEGRARGEAYNVEGGYWVKTWPDNITRIEITNDGFYNTVKIAVSVYDVGYDRMAGNISVDGAVLNKSEYEGLVNNETYGGSYYVAASAGRFSYVNLSVATGVADIIGVSKIIISASLAGFSSVDFFKTGGGGVTNELRNSNINSNYDSSYLLSGNTIGSFTPASTDASNTLNTLYGLFATPANESLILQLNNPILLSAGNVLSVTHGTANANLSVFFEVFKQQ